MTTTNSNSDLIGLPAAKWVSIDSVHPWKDNPRKITEKAVQKVANSIKRFGFANPIIARQDGSEIIAGHTRYRAALLLKLKAVPVRYVDISERDAHLLAIADNRLGEETAWNDQMLASILGEYVMAGDDEAEVAGFTDDEIKRLMEENVANMIEEQEQATQQMGGLTYQVLVECKDEKEQSKAIEQLEAAGMKCKPLIV